MISSLTSEISKFIREIYQNFKINIEIERRQMINLKIDVFWLIGYFKMFLN